MRTSTRITRHLLGLLGCLPLFIQAATWEIPLAGNTFQTAPEPGGGRSMRRGWITLSDSAEVYSVFFHLNQPAHLSLELLGRTSGKPIELSATIEETTFPLKLATNDSEWISHPIGTIEIQNPGYTQLDLKAETQMSESLGHCKTLRVRSSTPGLQLDYVKNNDGNMFYWGRRGPSVHLRYSVPRDQVIQYAYNEVTVPEGSDPIGSFYMANGFGEGYFGMQVNSRTERRILFSVWSPFKTDDPKSIPEDQRIVMLAKGKDVHVGEFGNEGSGGQSYLRFPWQAGKTYQFLIEVKPDGTGSTRYTAWFGEKSKPHWHLIASFRRPQTDTWLRGFHSFLESFSPAHGYLNRQAYYGNTWVRDNQEQWHECLDARFSVDATGRGRHRLDYQGGSNENRFFLRNCGFFNDNTRPGEQFERGSSAPLPPKISFDELSR